MAIDTLETITALLRQRLTVPIDQLRPEQTLEQLGIDSLAMMEFMFDIENALGISFDDETPSVVTVRDVIALVERAIANRGGPLSPQLS